LLLRPTAERDRAVLDGWNDPWTRGFYHREGWPGRVQPGQKDAVMSILISVLITFLVVILVLYLVNMLPVDGRLRQIIQVIVIIIGVLSLLRALGVGFGTI
jgi:hypothetical protein